MPVAVRFRYHTGLERDAFAAASLVGSWDEHGRPSQGAWTARPMDKAVGEDGCPVFTALVELDPGAGPAELAWGVWLRPSLSGGRVWGVFAEVDDPGSSAQHRTFTLDPAAGAGPPVQACHLTRDRWLGAQRWLPEAPGPSGAAAPGQVRTGPGAAAHVRFAVWAPHALAVEVVFGGASGYVADDGHGIDQRFPPLAMRPGPGGVWEAVHPGYASFVGRRYMFRVTRDDGSVAYRTDMFSREQTGRGDHDPDGRHYDGSPAGLDGTPSCSVVVDPSLVGAYPPAPGVPPATTAAFWDGELDPARPLPRRVEDLVVYELHVGALDPSRQSAGTFADAIDCLPYLDDLGVNAVELLPMLEFNRTRSWGYGTSHFLAVEASAGGRDGLKHFVKACHRRGIAVVMDVVFNHYTDDSARAAWQYDSLAHERNGYYWYQGRERDHPSWQGGYVANESSGWAPRYHEEQVRTLFVASAVMLMEEFHVDGFRVDQTTSIHAYNRLVADGRALPAANVAGRKLLRELCQTLKAVRPDVMLMAEDHSGWDAVTRPAGQGGLGFDATWYVDFYHHLVGDKDEGPGFARLLWTAGRDQHGPLAMGGLADALRGSAGRAVVYAESHDEAGNAEHSKRTIRVAVDDAPLVGETRRYAEARCRFAFGMVALSAGTPMFLMGEEVGATKDFTYDRFSEDKEDLPALRAGSGAHLFRFYQEVIALRLANTAAHSRDLEVVHADDGQRVIAFRRWGGPEELLVMGSLGNRAFGVPGYRLWHPSLAGGGWREVFNSDAARYGGDNVGNAGATLHPDGDRLDVVVPANGFVVLRRAG